MRVLVPTLSFAHLLEHCARSFGRSIFSSMVCFECSTCNETIKKPKLAKHLEHCGSYYVSCIDCNKVFGWDEWESHTSCVSEAQKYQGKLYEAKESTNKGQVKQDAWIDNVQKKVDNPEADITPAVRSLLQKLLGFNNIPRKQKPFTNFVKNSLKIWDEKKISDMWDVIFSATAKPAAEPKAAPTPAPATKADSEAKEAEAKDEGSQEFDWKAAVDAELDKVGGEVDWRQLRDSLVAIARARGGVAATVDEKDLQNMALAGIPETYLSQEDSLVRLPPKKKPKKQ